MHKLTPTLIILVSICLSGCASWPEKGSGGMAEHHLEKFIPAMPNQPIGPEHGQHFALELLSRHLDALAQEGAELCFPATVIQAQHRQNRIARELQGGLNFDAANDIIIQRKLLGRLERQLDYVKQQDICILPFTKGQQWPGDIGKRLQGLLNFDNQFPLNSSELNPKYIGRLAEAVQLLRKLPTYTLRVIGHADILGEENGSQDLSLARAKKVGRYLQILGLPSERIQIDTIKASDSLFKNKEPHIRLANRLVSIELIETIRSVQTGKE